MRSPAIPPNARQLVQTEPSRSATCRHRGAAWVNEATFRESFERKSAEKSRGFSWLRCSQDTGTYALSIPMHALISSRVTCSIQERNNATSINMTVRLRQPQGDKSDLAANGPPHASTKDCDVVSSSSSPHGLFSPNFSDVPYIGGGWSGLHLRMAPSRNPKGCFFRGHRTDESDRTRNG